MLILANVAKPHSSFLLLLGSSSFCSCTSWLSAKIRQVTQKNKESSPAQIRTEVTRSPLSTGSPFIQPVSDPEPGLGSRTPISLFNSFLLIPSPTWCDWPLDSATAFVSLNKVASTGLHPGSQTSGP
jgi:hypothetical protein